MKLKIWGGLIKLTKNQFIIIEIIFFVFFLLLSVFFFSYKFPAYIDDPIILFHAKYLKYVCLLATFFVVIEAQFYLNKYITEHKNIIEEQNNELILQHKLISKQQTHITDSLRYASRIQTALLPSPQNIPRVFEHFILFKPKEIVSGDYYWFSEKNNKLIIVAADCTGHGVPGAFMSVMGITFLNEIVNKTTEDIKADEILNQLRDKVIKAFENANQEETIQDGMDIALYIIDQEKQELEFAGANNPLFLIRKIDKDNEEFNETQKITITKENNYFLTQIKGDSMPIGNNVIIKPFISHRVELKKKDTLYIFSDGYIDQFGGDRGRKFLIRNFRTLLLQIQDKSMVQQKEFLNNSIEEWRTKNKELKLGQLDDILIFGIRIF